MQFIEQTMRKPAKLIISTLIIALLFYLSYIFYTIIIIVSLAVLLSFIFNPVVNFIEKSGLTRLPSVLILFLTCGVAFYFLLSVFMPALLEQLNRLTLMSNEEEINQFVKITEDALKKYVPFLSSVDLSTVNSKTISIWLANSVSDINNILSSIFSVLAISVIVPFISFFLLKDSTQLAKGIIGLMPNKYFEMSYWVLRKTTIQLGRFVRSWLLDALVVAILSMIGLSILGIENSITIGIIAGIGHLIPFFGPIIGGIPAVLISVLQFGDFSMFPQISIMFLIIYTFDNGFIQPNFFSKSTDIHPVLIIILILVGSQLLGIFGMLFAVPIATVVKTATREIYFGLKNYNLHKV